MWSVLSRFSRRLILVFSHHLNLLISQRGYHASEFTVTDVEMEVEPGKGAVLRFAYLQKISRLNLSGSPFVIRVNLLRP